MAFRGRDLAFELICRNEFVTEPADSADAAIVPFQIGRFEIMESHASGVSDLRRSFVRCGTPKGIAVGDGFAPPRCPQVVCTGKVPAVAFTTGSDAAT
ncbi:MAG: hypothetical protein JWP89_1281 [Schlesneria sp.]|nr:hypothetical protein [Schlesneria sp.]